MQCYMDSIGEEAMSKNPSLSAICFLIESGGNLKTLNHMGRNALNIISDPIITSFLDYFYLPFQMSSDGNLSSTTMPATSQAVERALANLSIPTLIIYQNVPATDPVDANLPPALTNGEITSVQLILCILCSNRVITPHQFVPCRHPVACCPGCVTKLKRCITCNQAPPPANFAASSSNYIKQIEYVVEDEESEYRWRVVRGASRKGNDRLEDGRGNQYTRRPNSTTVWQCPKQSATGKNRCPVIVRELKGEYHLEKGPHKHSTTNGNLNSQ